MNITFLERIDERAKTTLEKIISNNKLDRSRLMDRIQLEFDMNPDVTNPSAYLTIVLRKIYLADYKKVPLSINRIVFDYDAWKKRWDDKGFSGKTVTHILIIRIYENMVNEFPVTLDEIRELDKSVTDYCVKKELHDYAHILRFIRKSKVYKKCNVPLRELIKDAKKAANLIDFFAKRDEQNEEFDPTFSIEDIENMNKLDVNESKPSL